MARRQIPTVFCTSYHLRPREKRNVQIFRQQINYQLKLRLDFKRFADLHSHWSWERLRVYVYRWWEGEVWWCSIFFIQAQNSLLNEPLWLSTVLKRKWRYRQFTLVRKRPESACNDTESDCELVNIALHLKSYKSWTRTDWYYAIQTEIINAI